MRTWRAIAWPSERKQKHGLYQVQFVPGLVEDVLSLCLSHHDELRRCAVSILHSMIMSEVRLPVPLLNSSYIDLLLAVRPQQALCNPGGRMRRPARQAVWPSDQGRRALARLLRCATQAALRRVGHRQRPPQPGRCLPLLHQLVPRSALGGAQSARRGRVPGGPDHIDAQAHVGTLHLFETLSNVY